MRKEIAVICSHFAVDARNGYSESINLYYALSEKYKINIIVPRWLDGFFGEAKAVRPNVTIRNIAVGQIISRVPGMWVLDYIEKISKNKTLQKRLKQAAENAEIIICDAIYYVSLAKEVFPDKTVVYRSLDIEFDKAVWCQQHAGSQHQLPGMVESALRFERKACNNADLIFTLTQADADRLCTLYSISKSKMKILPLCFSKAYLAENYVPRRRKKGEREKALFVNSAPMENNEDFVQMTKKLSNIEFHIVGKSGMELKDYSSNVVIHGIVSDAMKRKISSECDFALNLTYMTFGMNAKIIDYFSLGIPVLANEAGVRGYNVQAGKEYFPACFDTLEDDITKFSRLSEEERYEIALNAFHYLCSKLNYKNYINLVEELMDSETIEEKNAYYIFGAGNIGKHALQCLKEKGYHCIGFADNDVSRQGETYCSLKIFSPSEVFRDINTSNNKILVIAGNIKHINEFARQIDKQVDAQDIYLFYNNMLIESDICIDKLKELQ